MLIRSAIGQGRYLTERQPYRKTVAMPIPPEDLEVSCYPDPLWPSMGMVAGMPRPIVKVLHKPTEIFAVCGSEKSQHKNRTIALRMVEYGLAELGYPLSEGEAP